MVIDWSPRARSDLDDLVNHIKQHSPSGARRVAARIHKRVDDLLQFPEIGVPARGGLRRLDVTRTPYLVIYRIQGQTITVVAVLHERRKRRH